jgi:hypothetical protein
MKELFEGIRTRLAVRRSLARAVPEPDLDVQQLDSKVASVDECRGESVPQRQLRPDEQNTSVVVVGGRVHAIVEAGARPITPTRRKAAKWWWTWCATRVPSISIRNGRTKALRFWRAGPWIALAGGSRSESSTTTGANFRVSTTAAADRTIARVPFGFHGGWFPDRPLAGG